uniref:Myb/SANT-like DNA-binding domain-containing protein n=1 Tax=Gopherus agassizii TaxID=38772 RepID=A0A452GSR1_9SAUR
MACWRNVCTLGWEEVFGWCWREYLRPHSRGEGQCHAPCHGGRVSGTDPGCSASPSASTSQQASSPLQSRESGAGPVTPHGQALRPRGGAEGPAERRLKAPLTWWAGAGGSGSCRFRGGNTQGTEMQGCNQGGASGATAQAPAWTVQEVLDLIAVWGEDSMLTELCSKRQNEKTFEKISKAMMERGHSRDSVQCRKTKEANGSSPPLSVDSEVGVILAFPEDSADGEDEEEEEEDELAESTQHSVLPNSQELFLSLTEVPSQPSQATIPDNEAMEGTSGECTFVNIKHGLKASVF